jgi:cation-transporting ATPase 13A2
MCESVGRAKPYPRINPKRPTANLVSKQVLVSLLGQILLTSGFQLFVFFYIRSQPWYIEPKINPIKLKIKNYENTALFLISSFQYIFVAAIFCVGPPYRQPVHTNTLFLLTLVALGTFSLYTLFVTGGPVFKLLQLIHLPREFHLELSLLVVANIVLSYLFEKHLVFPLAKGAGRALKRWRAYRGKSRKSSGKLYKAIG